MKKETNICRRIQKRLERAKVDAKDGWHFGMATSPMESKRGIQTRYVVSLLNKTCSCNAWQLSGVLCHHAVTTILKSNELPESYISHWSNKETYLKAYEFPLEPLNGPNDGPQSMQTPIESPVMKVLNNRRETKRRPSVGESEGIKVTRAGQPHKCSMCGQIGHNKKKCRMSGT
ncbi:uncharacterized protein LOC110686809 [Chenopodium quinoa]|uniref:uncharacterized protein LOC110686809 n=1 Tax=Chenopodium quinoa TaxID=63459 RepID=UPI000B78740A|nr:uncharacterized protein LOC110686809 [Chenopodium quinoa]